MKRFILATSFCALLLIPAINANAQTANGPVSMNAPSFGTAFTPERAVQILQSKGAKTQSNTTELAGIKTTRVSASLSQNNFNFSYEVVFVTPASGKMVWWYNCVLNTNAKSLPLNKLQSLMKDNNVMAGDSAFMINPQWALVLSSRTYAGSATDQNIHDDLSRFMRNIRETSNLWYVAQ